MASPYALDFNPLAQAIQFNRQSELAKNRLAMDEERLGFERDMQPLKLQSQQQEIDQRSATFPLQQRQLKAQVEGVEDEQRARTAGHIAKLGEALEAEPDPAKRLSYLQTLKSHPQFGPALAGIPLPPEMKDDPIAVARYFAAQAAPYRDQLTKRGLEAGIEAKQAEAAKDRAAAEQGKFLPLGENAQGVFDTRTRSVIPIGPGGQQQTQRTFDKEFAKKAPELYTKAADDFSSANEVHETLNTLEALAPHASTGFAANQILMLRKAAAQVGIGNSDRIAPTELFHMLSQQGVFSLVQKLKPASNVDMIASERATASIQSDPSTLPIALPVLRAVAQRSMLARRLEMEALRQGQPPDAVAITAEVNKRVPLIDPTKMQSGPSQGPQVQKPNTDRLPQAPQVGATRAGRDGITYRFKGGNPALPESWERMQ